MLNLHIQPRARAPGVDGLHGPRLRVRLAAPPVDGKANEELIGLLALAFGLPRPAVKITRGAHAGAKTVELSAPRTLPAWFTALGGQPCPGREPSLDSRPRRRPGD
ncbi:MAG TPA: DUF167 domain-containing protein [Gammaproteobacteria bacterium]|nr:DUF167 domain-containing protein [Gammaproteobacteria bacterium]